MKVSYHGHSVVKIESHGKTILIDPFITGNSNTDLNAATVQVDVILLTHGHGDHLGDTVDIAKRNDALVIASPELADMLSWEGVRTHPMSIGGAYTFDFGKVKITQAFHSSSYVNLETQTIIYTGMPTGILFTAEGKTIYHAGDTGLFYDMKVIGERNDIDLAFLPIGDNHTMGPEDAALASDWLQAKQVVPIHFNTFPFIKQDPRTFVSLL
ncbi:metal-dependent hydrolase [Priestia sp. FSL H7-0729]